MQIYIPLRSNLTGKRNHKLSPVDKALTQDHPLLKWRYWKHRKLGHFTQQHLHTFLHTTTSNVMTAVGSIKVGNLALSENTSEFSTKLFAYSAGNIFKFWKKRSLQLPLSPYVSHCNGNAESFLLCEITDYLLGLSILWWLITVRASIACSLVSNSINPEVLFSP